MSTLAHAHNVSAIILAAGHGSRMKSTLPKVLHPLKGKPLVEHVVDHVIESTCCAKPIVVVPSTHTLVQDHLGTKATYVVQYEQLGTGHAVMQAESVVPKAHDIVLVLNADVPNISAASIDAIIHAHKVSDATITITSTVTPDFLEWREAFRSFGRIIRNTSNDVMAIVEYKDASEEQKNITEVNGGIYCFTASWLWNHLHNVKNNNVQQEYYLTDLIDMAISEQKKVCATHVDPKEVVGISTQEDLAKAQTL